MLFEQKGLLRVDAGFLSGRADSRIGYFSLLVKQYTVMTTVCLHHLVIIATFDSSSYCLGRDAFNSGKFGC